MIDVPPTHLVDTNIPVYSLDPRDPAKQARAIEVMEVLTATGRGALSTQILGEFFVTATRKIPTPLSPADGERIVTYLTRSMTVYEITPLAVLEAIRATARYSMSYWDALIWATAKLNNVPNVLSEDFGDGALIEGVRFQNPLVEQFDVMDWVTG